MALLHALVANDSTILAESHGPSADIDVEAGNTFSNATSTILSKIPPNDSKVGAGLKLPQRKCQQACTAAAAAASLRRPIDAYIVDVPR